MIRTMGSFLLGVAVVAFVAAPVRAQGADGTWKLSYVTNGAIENTAAIIKIKTVDGKATGELVAGNPRFLGLELKSVSQDGPTLRVALQVGTGEFAFETTVPKEASKRLLGTMNLDGTLAPGLLAATDDATIDAKSASRLLDCPPLQQARTLATRPLLLRFQAQQAKDPEKKQDLLKQAAEADATAKRESPRLYREVLDKHADSPGVFDAALNLIRGAKASGAKAEEVQKWAAASVASSKAYGSRFEGDFASQVASALLAVEGMEKLATEYARQAEKALTDKASASEQIRVLGLLVRVLKKNGLDKEAATYDTRVEKLESVLDKEYSAKMPGFKGTTFTGRKSNSDRAVFMELFTGATCPPCVAADLAFDVLQKSYKPSELVLIQYHLHIPGPDPMTNPDTEARWAYYRKTFPKEIAGVPSSIFNGKPAARGGGSAAGAEKKYEAYREVIDPLLEEKAGAKLVAETSRDGDRININVKVSDLVEPDANKKLRIILAEETIRYAGSNRIRLHHNVVRAFPGGVDGVSLKEAASRHQASIHLGNLRTDLTKYLDNYEANFRAFANPARPMAFANLRVIAFVQDDNTREILQAVQVPVQDK